MGLIKRDVPGAQYPSGILGQLPDLSSNPGYFPTLAHYRNPEVDQIVKSGIVDDG